MAIHETVKIQGTRLQMKVLLILLLTVLTYAVMADGLLRPGRAVASINAVNPWPSIPPIVSNGATGTITGKVVAGAGASRLLLVSVACEYTATPVSQTMNVYYGGKSLTQIATNITQKSTIWLGYLKETDILGATSTTLSVTNGNTTNLLAMYVTSSVYAGVDQTTPTTGSATAATAGAANLTLTSYSVSGKVGNAGASFYVVNWNGQTSTPSAGYTEEADYAGANFNLASSYKFITTSGTEAPTSTAAAATSGAMVGVGLNPAPKLATVTTCGDCHGYGPIEGSARNVPDGQFTGSHNRHSGTAELQYGYACTRCHYDNTTNNHSRGFKNITGSSVAGSSYSQGKKIAITDSPTFGTCGRSTCHSTGRSNIQYATSPTWGQTGTCLSCHGGRSGATGNPTKSSQGFSLSTTHSQHLKYSATTTIMNCNVCHAKTAADAAKLKSYTGVTYHANGTNDVLFTNIAYASITSYKTASKMCTNTACHGGTSRNVWSNSGPINSDNTCVHCHGVAGTSTLVPNSGYNRRLFAPGWKGTVTGTSTDQKVSSNDIRVGSHFKHLSSVYMKSIRCNECHLVPTSPFQGTHMATTRYNSQTLTFGQASSATITIGVANGSTPSLLASFGGFTSGTANKAATCSSVYCHGNRLKDGDTSGSYRKPYWNYSAMINYSDKANACGRCHGNPPTAGTSAGSHSGKTATTSCSGCHGAVVDASGTIINKMLHINGIMNVAGCTGCHGNPPSDSSIGTSTGLATPATNATSPGAHVAHATTMSILCAACHNNTIMGSTDNKLHIQFKVNATTFASSWKSGSTAPFGSFSGAVLSASYTGYSTGATKYGVRASGYTCNTYCHASWAGNGGAQSNPSWTNAATGQCGACHFKDAASVPATGAAGSHSRHASSNGTSNYAYKCSFCHSNVNDTTKHVQGYAQVYFDTQSSANGSYSRITAGARYNGTDATTGPVNSTGLAGIAANYKTCSSLYCHSSGRALGTNQYNTPTWGGTDGCLACHAGRNGATGAPAKSLAGFSLSTTHSQHFKYFATDMNCNICHSQTVTDAATLKIYSGVKRHVNGKRDVTFSGITYGSYTAYKSNETGSSGTSRTCVNISCHGGKSRSPWSASSINSDNTCVHCHGVSGTTTNDTNRNKYAPGWGGTGISTDGNTATTDIRVGAHYAHLSSVYIKKLKCNECHLVPSKPFEGTHMASPRYNSQTLTFAQASTATKNGVFVSFTSGTAIKAATCSTTYCHGSKMPKGDTSGSAKKPSWNQDTLIARTPDATTCGRCHGNPPTAGSSASTHSGKTATTSCNGCHGKVVNSSGAIINKALHSDGTVQSDSSCLDCHGGPQGIRVQIVGAASLGSNGDDFMRPSRHVKGSGSATAIVKNLDCVICHAEGDTTSTEAIPVKHATLHGDGTINLRDVDTPASYFNWPGKRSGGATITSANRDDMDTFCMRCHDSDTSSATASRGGAYGIAVNSTNTALLTTGPVARRTTPFNTLDGGSALDVRGQFNYQNLVGSAWASHHNLNQFSNKRYTATYASTYSTRGGWTGTSKDGATMGWATGLHCSDCHLNEANAHGTRNTPRMLMTSAGTDATYTYTADSSSNNLVCFRCHLNTVYANNATDTTKARLGHQDLDPKPFGTGYSADTRAVATCLNCHGGGANGGIHGNNRSISANATMGVSATKAYRFMYGSELGYGTMSDANWANTSQPSCYTSSGTWGGTCNSHNGGTSTGRIGTPRYSRPLQ